MSVMRAIDLSTDGHVHTSRCGHAVGGMEEYIQAALAVGLKKIVFLEHLEAGISYFERTWLTREDFREYRLEGEELRRRYAGRIEVGIGVEVGYNPECVGEIRTFLEQHEWDRIGLSYHFFRAGNRHINLVSRKQENIAAVDEIGLAKVVEGYYQGLIQAMDEIRANVVCHLDAGLRYHPELASVDQTPYLNEALRKMAATGLALEVNTSGYRIRDMVFPEPWVLSRARELGIPLWPGSDAHRPADVGRDFGRLRGDQAS
jgi:histidinol-phosphatase (PHP family)